MTMTSNPAASRGILPKRSHHSPFLCSKIASFSTSELKLRFKSALSEKRCGNGVISPSRKRMVVCLASSSSAASSTLPAALLFDCDGVLVDTEKDGHRVSFNDTFAEKELGVTWDVDLYGELLKIGGGKERMTAYFNKTSWPGKAPKTEEERKDFVASLHKKKTELFMALIEKKQLPLRPGVARLFDEALAKGIKVAVCSTSNEKAGLRNSDKKAKNLTKKLKTRTLQSKRVPSKDNSELPGESLVHDRSNSNIDLESSSGSLNENVLVAGSSRSAVLQACVFTSGCLLALGAVVRQVSHIAFTEGAPVFDATEISFSFEAWHVEWIIGLVILISSCRYVLLKTWPDFSESSEAANQQVLGSLQPLDYIIVAFLPGISEELLFRGALLPIFGLDWRSALAVGAIFGCLHLGNGRKYSFAVWATFVGFAYGLATINSSSIVAAMAAHSLNNLVGGILWRYTTVFKRNKN